MSNDAVDRAIDTVEARQAAEELAKLEPRDRQFLDLLVAPHAWGGEEEITLRAPADNANRPVMLLYDESQLAWRAILLPAGSEWRVVPDRPALWTPGGPA